MFNEEHYKTIRFLNSSPIFVPVLKKTPPPHQPKKKTVRQLFPIHNLPHLNLDQVVLPTHFPFPQNPNNNTHLLAHPDLF